MNEEETFQNLEQEITNALERRDANNRGGLGFQNALNYQGDSELMELSQDEMRADHNYTELLNAVRDLQTEYTNDNAEAPMDWRAQELARRNYTQARRELLIVAYTYVEAINRHEDVRFRRIESARQEAAFRQRQTAQRERGGRQAEVAQSARELLPPRAGNRQDSGSSSRSSDHRTRGHQKGGKKRK